MFKFRFRVLIILAVVASLTLVTFPQQHPASVQLEQQLWQHPWEH